MHPPSFELSSAESPFSIPLNSPNTQRHVNPIGKILVVLAEQRPQSGLSELLADAATAPAASVANDSYYAQKIASSYCHADDLGKLHAVLNRHLADIRSNIGACRLSPPPIASNAAARSAFTPAKLPVSGSAGAYLRARWVIAPAVAALSPDVKARRSAAIRLSDGKLNLPPSQFVPSLPYLISLRKDPGPMFSLNTAADVRFGRPQAPSRLPSIRTAPLDPKKSSGPLRSDWNAIAECAARHGGRLRLCYFGSDKLETIHAARERTKRDGGARVNTSVSFATINNDENIPGEDLRYMRGDHCSRDSRDDERFAAYRPERIALPTENTCPCCGDQFAKRKGTIYCSDNCRKLNFKHQSKPERTDR